MITVKQILKRVSDPRLNLYKGDGYWYFAFDDGVMFETHSEYTMRLNDYGMDRWVEIGKNFIAKMEQK